MLVDSHCHLDRVDLAHYDNSFDNFIAATREAGVGRMLCVAIDLAAYPAMLALVEGYDDIDLSIGVHPSDKEDREPNINELVELAKHPKNVAIGETGLDYFHGKGDLEWQRDRFRIHIQAAHVCNKPLIIHTREAKADTLQIMREEGASNVGGVMHCFTEDWAMAEQALEMGFYISFSGIITFRNADQLREVAKRVPLDRLLIETDSPYLAPAPHRGKPNQPLRVAHVAEMVAHCKDQPVETIIEVTGNNYSKLFNVALAG
jgi:TatD DNase family protein